jgi:hypothetical protein
MADNQLICGLRKQYARTLGLIAAGEDRAEDLEHLAAVIRMFRPDENLSRIKPVRPYKPQRRSWTRTALDTLRREGRPLTARELAHKVLSIEGGEPDDLFSIEASLHATLGRLEGDGVVRVSSDPKRWTLG